MICFLSGVWVCRVPVYLLLGGKLTSCSGGVLPFAQCICLMRRRETWLIIGVPHSRSSYRVLIRPSPGLSAR